MVKILYRFVCHFSNIDTDFICIEEGRDVRRDKQSLSRAFHIDARLDDHFTTSALTEKIRQNNTFHLDNLSILFHSNFNKSSFNKRSAVIDA